MGPIRRALTGHHAMVSANTSRVADGLASIPSAHPVAPSERIDSIDVLRGLALFGVLTVNIVFEFRVSIFEQFLPPTGTEAAVDRALRNFLAAAFGLKALALFSFLFGVGLAIQFDRLANHHRRLALLVRRLAVLLAIGAAHLLLIWNGDILVEYALAGLLVLPFLFAPRWLVLVAATAALAVYLAMPLLPPVVQLPTNAWMRAHIAEAAQAYGTGGILDALVFRVREIPAIFPLHALIFPRTIALFLFGGLAWRTGILLCPSNHRRLLFKVAVAGLILGAGLTVAVMFGWPALGRAQDTAERLGGVMLALAYAATVIGCMTLPAGHKMLGWAAPVGRMAFTNYIAQSLILGWIFYGHGLGLFGRLSVTAAFATGVAVYVAQVAFSAWWLRRYRYGPIEWLWRTLMYGNRQPMIQRQM
jgi:uncharacterized protein